METDQLEAAVDRVGHAAIGKKTGLAGLLDDPPVGALGGVTNGNRSEQRHHDKAEAAQIKPTGR